MTTDNKTLADVQPGGMVRLGDQAERAKFEAWVKNHVSSLARAADGDYASNFTHALWSAWQAALSAQPSPGGQDALDCIGRIEEAIEFRVPHDIYAAVHGELAELKAALAGRQPVGEPVMYQVRPRNFNDGEGWRKVTKREYDDRGPFPGYDETEWERRTLYAAPPAQAVGLGELREMLESWKNSDYPFSYEGQCAQRALDACVADLQGWLDSQAVGK